MRSSPPVVQQTFEALTIELLDRGFRATLHRLNGVRSLLAGWATLGVPNGQDGLLQKRLEEDRTLLARLAWIRGIQRGGPREEILLAGEAPRVLMAAGLALGTPEEAAARLPQTSEPRAALALALWSECVPGREDETVFGVRVEADGLVAKSAARAAALDAPVLQPYADLLSEAPQAHEIRFRAGLFAPLLEGGEPTPFDGGEEAEAS